MAVAEGLDFNGATREQYGQVIAKVGSGRAARAALPGGIFHWEPQTPGSIHVCDLWESREQFQKFAQDQIRPITAEVGVPEQRTVTFQKVHNYLDWRLIHV